MAAAIQFGKWVVFTQSFHTLFVGNREQELHQLGRNLLASLGNFFAFSALGQTTGLACMHTLSPCFVAVPLLVGITRLSLGALSTNPKSRLYAAINFSHQNWDRFAQLVNLVACTALLYFGAPVWGWVGIALGVQSAIVGFPYLSKQLQQFFTRPSTISHNSSVGAERLRTSTAKANAEKLIKAYEKQIKDTHCGIATSVVALNALFYDGEKRMTQESFYSEKLKKPSQTQVDKGGLPFAWLASILENLGSLKLTVSKHVASSLPDQQIRQSIIAALKDSNRCVLTQFGHPKLGQTGEDGHWSPLAAYDERSDSFLLLDVCDGPRWVSAPLLIEAMRTETRVKKLPRGFLILDKQVNPKISSPPSRTRIGALSPEVQPKPLPSEQIALDTAEGMKRLNESHAKANHLTLLRFYETQMPHCCGIATAVMALNALSIRQGENRGKSEKTDEKTVRKASDSFSSYRTQQQRFFEDLQNSRIVTQDEVWKRGISLIELGDLLKLRSLKVTVYKAVDLQAEKIRSVILDALKNKNPQQCVLANFQRGLLGQKSNGAHWSPVAAYHEPSDSYLILDVSRLDYGPYWVKASALIQAMQTRTLSQENSRGFLIVEKAV